MSDRFHGIPAAASAGLSAVFVSDGADDKPAITTIVGGMGARPLRFPAVLVPEGSASPGYPFVEFGEINGDPEAARPAGSSHQDSGPGRGLHARQSGTYARGHWGASRQAAESVTADEADASNDARKAGPAGRPPAIAHDPHGQLQDYAAEAVSAAIHALAVPPAYDSLSELVDRAVVGSQPATLLRSS